MRFLYTGSKHIKVFSVILQVMKQRLCLLLLLLTCLLTWGQDCATVLDMRNGLPENRIRAICQMADGRMAIATTATIEVYDGTRFISFPLPPQKAYPLPSYTGTRQLTCDTIGHIFLRNNRTLYVIDTRRNEVVEDAGALLKRLNISEADIAAWPAGQTYGSDTTAFVHDSYGGTWIGTKESGIIYTNARRARQFTTTTDPFVYRRLPNFVSSQATLLSARYAPSATNCTLDTDEYSYLGTREGVLVINRSNNLVATINETYGLLTNNIASILADNHGDVWVATAGGGITRLHIIGRDSFTVVNYGLPDGIRTENREFRTCQMHRDAESGLFTVGFVGGTVTFHPDSVTAPCHTFHYPAPTADRETAESPMSPWVITAVLTGLAAIIMTALQLKRKRTKTPVKPETVSSTDVSRTISDTVQKLVTAEDEQMSAEEVFMTKLQDTIGQHLCDEDFSVQQLSELMAMDRTVLYRRMQKLTGISPSVYIRQIRMEMAQRLLLETDMPISDIATKTGFSTTKYFSSTFKEMTGMSPTAFREERA